MAQDTVTGIGSIVATFHLQMPHTTQNGLCSPAPKAILARCDETQYSRRATTECPASRRCIKSTMLPSITAASLMRWLSLLCLLQLALGFVDFGTITQPFGLEPTITAPRPHQLPDDVWMRYAPFQSHITAVAPSVRPLSNGSYATSWSMHFHLEPTRTVTHPGLRRRGVLAPRGILPPITNCRQCDINGNPVSNSNSTDSGSPSCSVVNYEVRLAACPSDDEQH